MTDRVMSALVTVGHWLFHGSGKLGGALPDDTAVADGRAKVLNEPARVRIRVHEARSGLLVASTISAADGQWVVEGLSMDVQYRVVGVDPQRRVNSAIQDWVYPAPMEP